MPIMMKRKDGTITPFRNAEYLSAYYFIPKRILEQCGKELNSIPRNPQKLIRDYNAVAVVESDLFIQLMMDAYAYMVWPYMCPGEYMEVYSGYDPAWIFAHSPAYWVQEMLEENVIPSSSRLLRMNGDIDWVTEEEANDILLWLVPQTMAHHEMSSVIAIAEEYRCFEDFDTRASNQKKDFYAWKAGPEGYDGNQLHHEQYHQRMETGQAASLSPVRPAAQLGACQRA